MMTAAMWVAGIVVCSLVAGVWLSAKIGDLNDILGDDQDVGTKDG